jgi:hypothetical protein
MARVILIRLDHITPWRCSYPAAAKDYAQKLRAGETLPAIQVQKFGAQHEIAVYRHLNTLAATGPSCVGCRSRPSGHWEKYGRTAGPIKCPDAGQRKGAIFGETSISSRDACSHRRLNGVRLSVGYDTRPKIPSSCIAPIYRCKISRHTVAVSHESCPNRPEFPDNRPCDRRCMPISTRCMCSPFGPTSMQRVREIGAEILRTAGLVLSLCCNHHGSKHHESHYRHHKLTHCCLPVDCQIIAHNHLRLAFRK